MTDLASLRYWDRLAWAYENLEPVDPEYRVVWEDPDTPDAPAHILCPGPNWMAAAMHGGIVPPVEAKLGLKHDAKGRVLNGHILHETPPLGPMTEEQAIEYLVKTDIPRRVWEQSHNRTMFVICRTSQLPKTRVMRNAWRLKEAA